MTYVNFVRSMEPSGETIILCVTRSTKWIKPVMVNHVPFPYSIKGQCVHKHSSVVFCLVVRQCLSKKPP